MKIYRILFCFFVFLPCGLSQHLKHDVYIFGNLVDLENEVSFFKSLCNELDQNQGPFTVIINGDLTDAPLNSDQGQLQIDRIKRLIDHFADYPNGKLLLMPGDRDWDDNKVDGYQSILKLEKEIKSYCQSKKLINIKWPLKDGCPGPFDIELDKHLLLIGINSQWWNHRYAKPRASDAICKLATDQDIKEEFEDLIEENTDKNILIAAHHPIKSLGHYGGRYSFVDKLKPFPVLGAVITAYKQHIGSPYDLSNPKIQPYLYLITNALFFHNNIVMASSHDHNQQIMQVDQNYLINSGALGKASYVAKDHTTLFKKKAAGIMKITYYYSGEVNTAFLAFDNNTEKFAEKFAQTLYVSACGEAKEKQVAENLSYVPCFLYPTQPQYTIEQFGEPIEISAGLQYKREKFAEFIMGKHYRNTWATPIKVSYLNIDSTFQGLKAYKPGGGRQTLSLKFVSEKGDYYTFRSVDKDPSKALDYKLRSSIISKIFRDQTSAQHPYGALPVAHLINHIDILHATPKLYVLPDVNALGPFQKRYGGMLGMLEENPGKANKNERYFGNADKILKSNELFRKLYDDKKHIVDEVEFLRARLFDILVGDWSKHEDNWKWAAFKDEAHVRYRPIPRDRDHAFSKWDGLLPSLADLPFGLPNTEGFDHKIKGFKSLVYQARYMDRFLITESPLQVFIDQARYIQDHIDDHAIEKAVQALPKSSYYLTGPTIISKLKQRKSDLVDYAQKYYQWLSEEVEILGTVEKDHFEIETQPDGSVLIEIFHEEGTEGRHIHYSRTFFPHETKRIRIYGLNEDDIFSVNARTSTIEIILFGGKGEDTYYSNLDHNQAQIYDLDLAPSDSVASRFEIKTHWNHDLYEYDRHALKFDSWLPTLSFGFNQYNGISFSFGNTWTKQRWDKQDYASKHSFKANVSTQGGIGFSWESNWHHVLKKWNVLLETTLANPDYYNSFYGVGNSTVIDEALEVNDYYVANYNQYALFLGLEKVFLKKSHLSVKSGFSYNNNKGLDGTILDSEEKRGILGAGQSISTLPILADFSLDFRDHPTLPSSGMRLQLNGASYFPISKEFNSYGNISGALDFFFSTYNRKRITLGIRLGGTKGLGEVPIYHLANLGATSGLRGYTSQRYFGRSKVFANSEIRWQLAANNRSSIPIEFGVLGFFDLGKVINENDPEGTQVGFHSGYGAGFYLVPFSRSLSFAFTLSFSEENSFYPGFTFGTALK